MTDTTRRDAKQRSIAARLLICDELELDALDRMLTALEKRRDIVHLGQRTAWPARSRGEEITAALRELRDATTYTAPRPSLQVIPGGVED